MPSYNELDGAKIGASINGAEKMNNDKPRKAKDKVDIEARKKLRDSNKEIYYLPKEEWNPNNAGQNQKNVYTG